jgi:hypothetical protein
MSIISMSDQYMWAPMSMSNVRGDRHVEVLRRGGLSPTGYKRRWEPASACKIPSSTCFAVSS